MIGFAGLGDIGRPMAHRLIDRGYCIAVWNRTASKADPLVARGAKLASSPAGLFEMCEVIGLCLTSDEAVGEVANAMLAAAPAADRRTIVDLSTGSPARAIDLATAAARRNVGWVDAPVSGGVAAASSGTLTSFIGGDELNIAAAAPLLEALSARRTVMGGPGSGSDDQDRQPNDRVLFDAGDRRNNCGRAQGGARRGEATRGLAWRVR